MLLRRALMSSGELAAPTVHRCPRGRYTALSFTWSGHYLHVCSIYLPNAPAARVAYISSSLAPLAAAARAKGQLVYTGALRSGSSYWVLPGALATSAIVCIAQLQG